MKRVLFMVQLLLFVFFNLLLFLAIINLFHKRSVSDKQGADTPVYNGKEEFDPSLQRLSSVSKLEAYCDSLFAVVSLSDSNVRFEHDYPAFASSIVRKKFYHGYSKYSYTNNYMALVLEPLTGKNASAIVVPDDIMKYPYAACSQQSIIMMELMKRKGFTTRKVGFDGGEKFGGHFSFEVYYDNSWHFFDPDQEPDRKILAAYNRPGIEFLAKNESILLAAYSKWDSAKVREVFKSYSLGTPNRFEAPNAFIYQRVTQFLSYTMWLFLLLAFLLVRRKYLRLDNIDLMSAGEQRMVMQ